MKPYTTTAIAYRSKEYKELRAQCASVMSLMCSADYPEYPVEWVNFCLENQTITGRYVDLTIPLLAFDARFVVSANDNYDILEILFMTPESYSLFLLMYRK